MKRHFIPLLLIALISLWIRPIYAQTPEYTFSVTQDIFTPITGGLLLGTSSSDDQSFVDPYSPQGSSYPAGPGLGIGFDFTFNGMVFDRLAINNNGWISLGQSALSVPVNMSSSSYFNPISSTIAITPEILYNRIAGMACDLEAQAGAQLRLETLGVAPDRICVVQWTNYKKRSVAGIGDQYNFQIQLHETSNQVKIVYGQMQCNATPGMIQVGLRGPQPLDFNARQGSESWNSTTAAAVNTQCVTLSNVCYPTPGLSFNFDYPVADLSPNPANLASPLNGMTMVSPSTTLNWRSGGGFPSGYRLSLGTDNPPTNLLNNQDLGVANSYTPPEYLSFSTTYYWKVVPYNALGNAPNCPIWSFTAHPDPTIVALPYNQNWDAALIPNLPFGWSSIVQSTSTSSYLKTVTTSPHTAPNCAGIFNSNDTGADLILVSPPLSQNISINSIRLKFWAKGGTTYQLLVGIMTDPTDSSTFESLQGVTLTSSWSEYAMNLTSYTGTGKYIAIKHACTSTSQTIYVDEVLFEGIPANDLGATTIVGNNSPTVNQSADYTVGIHNWGSVTQSAYSVKLYNIANIELASVAGPAIAPGEDAAVQIGFTPVAEGAMTIYGKVVLSGDVNPANDRTAALAITVMPSGISMVTIGTGNLSEGIPWEYYYKSSLYETLYYPDEIGMTGDITMVSFYNSFVSNLVNKPIKLWLGTTQLADLSAGWINSDQLTLVYDGAMNFPAGANTINIQLQSPYSYTGGNLVLYAKRPLDTAYYNRNDDFKAQTVGTNRARKATSDTIDFNPAAPEAAGTLSGTFPKTSFTFVVSGLGSLSGTVSSGGVALAGAQVRIVGSTHSQITDGTGTYSFPILQVGDYTVEASKLGYTSQTLPITITANQHSTQDFDLTTANRVTVQGIVVGSDAITIGLSGATVHLDGPTDFDVLTSSTGEFIISGVPMNNSYSYIIQKVGYLNITGSITIGTTDYDLGTLVMNELLLPPVHVTAIESITQDQVALSWSPPGSTRIEDFETSTGGWAPSSNWGNPMGDWQWTNTYDVANYVGGAYPNNEQPPPLAHSGTGMWGTKIYAPHSNAGGFNYLSKTFYLSGVQNPVLSFWSWNNSYGSFDYGQVTVNGNIVWGPSWDDSPVSWEKVTIDLSAYANQASVTVQFQHYASATVNYAGWYIDDVYLSEAQTIAKAMDPDFPGEGSEIAGSLTFENGKNDLSHIVQTSNSSFHARALNGSKIWRFLQGDETNEAAWTLLTANTITDTTYIDTLWGNMPDGNYEWAVKGIYDNDIPGPVEISNMIRILRNDLAALSLSGNTTLLFGTNQTHTVRIKNTGTETKDANSYTVKLMQGTSELAYVSGPAIDPAQEIDINIPWTPLAVGAMTLTGKVSLAQDTVAGNDISPALNVLVKPTIDLAATAITGNTTPSVGQEAQYVVSISNLGINTENSYEVRLYNIAGTQLSATLGISCAPGSSVQIPINWTPTVAGADTIYAKVIVPEDQNVLNDQSPNLNCLVQPPDQSFITIGDGNQIAAIPIFMFWKSNLFETLYYPSEFGEFTGLINDLRLYNQFATPQPSIAIKIWLGVTPLADLSAGWIPSTALTLVFDGEVDFPSGENEITIPFINPYLYTNESNLVLMIQRPWTTLCANNVFFKAQTIGSNRARFIYSDTVHHDPVYPPAPNSFQLSGQFPKTTFGVTPVDLNQIHGTVVMANNQALEGVHVDIANTSYVATTDLLGQYQIQNVLPGSYNVSFSKYGFISQTHPIVLTEGEDLALNVTLQLIPTITVSGVLLASDTGSGVDNAVICLNGYADFAGYSTSSGVFSIPDVYANQLYSYTIQTPVHSVVSGFIDIDATDYDMGTTVLVEIPFAPGRVIAELDGFQTEASISWISPVADSLNITESFEAPEFPPSNWTQIITNTSPADTYGVYSTWCRFGPAIIDASLADPTEGNHQAGVGSGYQHQDEWMITPSFICPSNVYLKFDSYVFLGSASGGHYYVKVSTDDGENWVPLWDASDQTGGWNCYEVPIVINLYSYTGQSIKLAWHALGPATNDGLWYSWFVDNIYIGNAETRIRFADNSRNRSNSGSLKFTNTIFHPSPPTEIGLSILNIQLSAADAEKVRGFADSTRSLTGYKVWRLVRGEESSPASWTSLTPSTITTPSLVDSDWAALPNGSYRWAVKAIYTASAMSQPVFSNVLAKEIGTGMIAGIVRQQNNQALSGVTVTAGSATATTNNAGAYALMVPAGVYTVTAAKKGFQTETEDNVAVYADQNVTVNFILIPGSSAEDDIAIVTSTTLMGNYPNPFNPSTTISYTLKEAAQVIITIYNLKGQKVKTLVAESQQAGRFSIVWDGKNDSKQAVSSGIYYCHMRADSFTDIRKMLLME